LTGVTLAQEGTAQDSIADQLRERKETASHTLPYTIRAADPEGRSNLAIHFIAREHASVDARLSNEERRLSYGIA